MKICITRMRMHECTDTYMYEYCTVLYMYGIRGRDINANANPKAERQRLELDEHENL